ncbi:MAG: hypothetical protein HY720_16015 [Planctomycetes bacterium]|nr:hypothetical protein [Planctomycetota bacterium]
MNRIRATRGTIWILCLAIASAGCRHHAQIDVEAPGATNVVVDSLDPGIAVNGQIVEARSGFPESHTIRVSANGFHPRDMILQKSYRADVSLVLILFGIIPYFFTARLEERYAVRLEPMLVAPPPSPEPPPDSGRPGPEGGR